jgi:pyruvate dehydrogenase E2 component (dihydrolipoamide acetyltransferase)
MSEIEVKVPDIGDFKDVPVIEVLVQAGDTVKKDDALVTLESEKATFEVPSTGAGVIKALKVNVGDKVSQGSTLVVLEQTESTPAAAAAQVDDERPEDNVDEAAEVMEAPNAPPPASDAPAEAGDGTQLVELRVPDVGDFKDIPVIEILVKPGDSIHKDASVITLESEKATMEVPATTGGTIREIVVKVGDKVSQGSVIGTVEAGALRQAQGDTEQARGDTGQARGDTGQARGDTGLSVRASREPAIAAAPRQARGDNEPARGDTEALRQAQGDTVVHASPSIRRFARELGVDLHIVKGSGPSGRITREDVQRYVKTALQTGTSGGAVSGAGLGLAPWPKVDFAAQGPIETKPLTRIQKLSGPNLHRNWVMIPHVTNNDDADVTDLEEFRKQLNAENAKAGIKVTMLAFIIKAVVAALKEFPQFNSSLDGENLILKKYYNIGFAADTPGGLIVPVIKSADQKGILDIARETAELSSKGREGKLGPADMSGGTFTISSLGGIGGTYFTPIINAPEVAILGVCRASIRPVWNGKAFAPRLMLPLSLSYDHRVIDGAAAARFNAFLLSLLADLRRAIL